MGEGGVVLQNTYLAILPMNLQLAPQVRPEVDKIFYAMTLRWNNAHQTSEESPKQRMYIFTI